MIAAFDVHYDESVESVRVRTACVVAAGWAASRSAFETVLESSVPPAPYEPGAFYRRELPHLLAAWTALGENTPALAIVDGYVWLDDAGTPGLGAHFYEAIGARIPVVGVAKTAFRRASTSSGGRAREVLRGTSTKPLHVTAAGIDVDEAARKVAAMHGPHRLPTLLKRVDQLARGIVTA